MQDPVLRTVKPHAGVLPASLLCRFPVRFLQALCGVIAGTLFLHSGHDLDGAQNRLSFFGFTVAAAVFTANDSIPQLIEDTHIFVREASSGVHRTSTFVLAGALTALPLLVPLALTYSALPYFLIGLCPTPAHFFAFCGTVLLSLAVANSFVCFISAVAPSAVVGTTLSTATSALFFLFSGFFIPR